MKRSYTLLVSTAICVALGVMGVWTAEWCARRRFGYFLWSWQPELVNFHEDDRLKIYNRKFYEQNPTKFRKWPIPLELFDADQLTPVYLFKPNVRMKWTKTWMGASQLVPATSGEEAFWETNSWGFRGPEFSVTKPSGTIRIVCLGASTTTALYLRWDGSYPYFLQQELHQLIPSQPIEVINAGYVGLGIEDLLTILRTRVLPLRPDIVIFYEGNNSIQMQDFVGELPCQVGMPVGEFADCWLMSYPPWYRWLSRHSDLFCLLSARLGWENPPYPPMPHRFDHVSPKPSVITYKETLRQMVREAKAHGSLMVLSSFVSLTHNGLKLSLQENPRLFQSVHKQIYPLALEEVEQIYRDFNEQSEAVAREFGIPYADVASEFLQDPHYFDFDIIHINSKGSQVLAQLFAQHLAQVLIPSFARAQSLRTVPGT